MSTSTTMLVNALEDKTSRALKRLAIQRLKINRETQMRGLVPAAERVAVAAGLDTATIESTMGSIADMAHAMGVVCPCLTVRYALAIGMGLNLVRLSEIRCIMDACRPVMVTRHTGAVDWFKRETGLQPKTISHVDDPSALRGRIVVGILPLHIAAEIGTVWVIEMPQIPPEWRGRELSPDEMTQAGARLVCYRVRRLSTTAAGQEEQKRATGANEA